MATFKPILASSISGTLLDTEFSHRGRTAILRTAKQSTRHHTPTAINARALLARRIAIWRSLTDQFKRAWQMVAATTPVPDRFGTPRYLPPLQFFLHAYPYPMQIPGQEWEYAPSYGPTPTGLTILMRLDPAREPAVLFAYPKSQPTNVQLLIYAATSFRPHPTHPPRNARLYAASPSYLETGITWTTLNTWLATPQPAQYVSIGATLWHPRHLPAPTIWATAQLP